MWAALAEFSGGATVSPLDKVGNNSGSVSPVVGACSAADVASGQLFVTCGGHALSMSASTTTADTYNNGATPTSNLNNDATSTTGNHYRFAWGATTGNSAADQTSQSDTSSSLSSLALAVASFKAAAAAAIPDVGMALTVT
jgi:hypothetical protein